MRTISNRTIANAGSMCILVLATAILDSPAASQIVAWGSNTFGQTNVPPSLTNATMIACGGFHNLALRSDGTVLSWGQNNSGQTNVPTGLTNVASVGAGFQTSIPASLTNVVALVASMTSSATHFLAVRADRSVSSWGAGQPGTPPSLTNASAVSAGGSEDLALIANSTVVGWGSSPPP